VLARYEVRIAGELDATAATAFAGLSLAAAHGITVLRGELDQAALHGLLERIRALGLDLVDVRRVRVPAADQAEDAAIPDGITFTG
jgi:hypothetical protein